METEPQIAFEGIDPSDSVRRRVEGELRKLEKRYGRITSCRVVVCLPGKRRQHGNLFETKVHLALPDGREVNVTHNPSQDHAHEDAYVSIRDAFKAAQRQLQDEARVMRGKVKQHVEAAIARVKALIPAQDHGFLELSDGQELYFHRNSVLNDSFDRLTVGDRVGYAEEQGDKGPQASTVRPLGKHGML